MFENIFKKVLINTSKLLLVLPSYGQVSFADCCIDAQLEPIYFGCLDEQLDQSKHHKELHRELRVQPKAVFVLPIVFRDSIELQYKFE